MNNVSVADVTDIRNNSYTTMGSVSVADITVRQYSLVKRIVWL